VRGRLAVVLALAVFAAAVFTKLHAPLSEWDSFFLEAATNWAAGVPYRWVFDYPPLYPLSLVLPFWLFGALPETARLFNAAAVLAAAWLIYLAARNLSGRGAGIAAAALYLVNPVTAQGVQSLAGADSSLLPLFAALLAYLWSCPMVNPRGRVIVLAVVFALSLWTKINFAIAVIAGCFLYLLLGGRREKSFCPTTVLGISGGVVLFLITWSAVSLYFWDNASWASVFPSTFLYFYKAASSRGAEAFSRSGFELVRVAFWFSPFLLYLSFAGIGDVVKRGVFTGIHGFLAFLCVFYFTGHVFIGGSNYGFPRYHAAISPLLHLFAGIALAAIPGRLTSTGRRGLCAAAFLFPVLLIAYADPELLINLTLKQLMFYGDHYGIVIRVIIPLAAYAAFPFAAAAVVMKRSRPGDFKAAAITAATAALLGSSAALAVKQGGAAYATAYQYGASGKAAVLALVSGGLSGGETVMSTPEFIYDLHAAGVSGPGWGVWQSETGMYDFISERRPAFVVAGWTTHTRAQLRYLLKDEKMRALLDTKYKLSLTGTYFVWESRKIPASGAGKGT